MRNASPKTDQNLRKFKKSKKEKCAPVKLYHFELWSFLQRGDLLMMTSYE